MGDLITISEAARRLGVERQTAYRYAAEGKLEVVLVAGHKLVDEDSLDGVEVKAPGWEVKHAPDERDWTRAMTLKRLDAWNGAVASGRFDDPKTGKVDDGLVAAYELEVGWTHEELLAAAEKHFGNRVRGAAR